MHRLNNDVVSRARLYSTRVSYSCSICNSKATSSAAVMEKQATTTMTTSTRHSHPTITIYLSICLCCCEVRCTG